MRISPCIQSFTDLLTGLERETKPIYFIPYRRFRLWKNCLPIFANAGIVSKSSTVADKMPCAECGRYVEVKEDSGRYFCQCSPCGLTRNLKQEEITLYESSLDVLADFVHSGLTFEGIRKNVVAGRLTYLGRHTFHNGEYAVFVARGLTWQDAKPAIHVHCEPQNPRTHILILSVCSDDVQTGNSRIVQVPLIELVTVENGKLIFQHDRIMHKLVGVYGDAGDKARKEGMLFFEACFKKAIENNEIQQGDKEKWRCIAENDYGVKPLAFRTFWQKNAPKELKKAGNPGRKNRTAC